MSTNEHITELRTLLLEDEVQFYMIILHYFVGRVEAVAKPDFL